MRSRIHSQWMGLLAGVMLLVSAVLLVMMQLVVIQTVAAAVPPPPPPPSTTIPSTPPTTPIPTPKVACIDPAEVPYFWATADGKEHVNSFGPPAGLAAESSVDQANAELRRRLCGDDKHGGDRRMYQALQATVDQGNPNAVITHGQWEDGIQRFLSAAMWERAKLVAIEPRNYFTEYMSVKDGGEPTVGTSTIDYGASWALLLPVLRSDGTTFWLELRLGCGFQPISINPIVLT